MNLGILVFKKSNAKLLIVRIYKKSYLEFIKPFSYDFPLNIFNQR